jgi:sensor histidine kinase regulating citrate/malate metabolism
MISRSPRIISVVLIFLILIITCATVYSVSTQTRDALKGALQDQLQSVAGIAASEIDGDSFATIRAGDEETPAFAAIREQIRKVQRAAPDIRYIYTMRQNGSQVEFVVDGDYGYAPDAARIGQVYDEVDPELLRGFIGPSFDRDFTTDQWGTVLSGYSPIRDSAGNVVGLVGVDMDSGVVLSHLNFLNIIYYLAGIIAIFTAAVAIFILERRRMRYETAIEANEAYLNQIVSSVKAGIMIIDDEDLRVLDANPLALELIGLPKNQVVGHRVDRFIRPAGYDTREISTDPGPGGDDGKKPDIDNGGIHNVAKSPGTGGDSGKIPDNDNSGAAEAHKDKETNGFTEKDLIASDGKRISVIGNAVRVTIGGRSCLLETFIDDRERKKAITDLISLNRKLQILSTITRNDILSELFGLAGYIELLKDEKPELADNPLLRQLTWVMRRLQAKTRFFRDFEESGSKGPVWLNLEGVIGKAWESQPMSPLKLESDIRELLVYADPMIERVFFNLFDNIKRHGKTATTVRLSYRQVGKDLVIACEDDGIGVPDSEKLRIFNRGIGSDTGLGLFFAREVLAITGITIRETGSSGTGARFEITVPDGAFRFRDSKTGR